MEDKAQWGTNIFQDNTLRGRGRGAGGGRRGEGDGISPLFHVILIIPFYPNFAWLYPALLKRGLLDFSGGM